MGITIYSSIQYNTRLDTDDGHGAVGLYINDKFSYSKCEDLSIFIPQVFESIFLKF